MSKISPFNKKINAYSGSVSELKVMQLEKFSKWSGLFQLLFFLLSSQRLRFKPTNCLIFTFKNKLETELQMIRKLYKDA